jgi:hypothetical protein
MPNFLRFTAGGFNSAFGAAGALGVAGALRADATGGAGPGAAAATGAGGASGTAGGAAAGAEPEAEAGAGAVEGVTEAAAAGVVALVEAGSPAAGVEAAGFLAFVAVAPSTTAAAEEEGEGEEEEEAEESSSATTVEARLRIDLPPGVNGAVAGAAGFPALDRDFPRSGINTPCFFAVPRVVGALVEAWELSTDIKDGWGKFAVARESRGRVVRLVANHEEGLREALLGIRNQRSPGRNKIGGEPVHQFRRSLPILIVT